jgi:signal transduction histidine kinase
MMQMVAHDLRSPLMSAQVALDILLDKRSGALPEMARRQVQSLRRNISRLTAMTSDLLTIDKLEAGKLDIEVADVDLAFLVEDAAQTLLELARQKDVALSNDCEHWFIRADRGRTLQVMINLVSNAIKFSPASTSVAISAKRENGHVVVSVVDKGPGVRKEDQERIFSKFCQVDKGSGKGFGLGLAICKLIIEAQGGTIGVDSTPGEGSSFWFRIAESERDAASSNENPNQALTT